MTQRLQVLLHEDEFEELRSAAKARRTTVAEFVRQAIRASMHTATPADVGRKLAVVREAARFTYPTADMPELLRTIEQGYLRGAPACDPVVDGRADPTALAAPSPATPGDHGS